MSVIAILIAISLGLAVLFLGCFVWAVRSGQYEDTLTPSMRILADEEQSAGTGIGKIRKPDPDP
jgi:cbb3-type cytochrome oxidase maturation protein